VPTVEPRENAGRRGQATAGAAAVVAWEHSSLAVAGFDRALDFYRAAFGYELVFEDRGMTDLIERVAGVPGLECDLAQLRLPGSEHILELIAFRAPPAEGSVRPPSGHVAFQVADLDHALAEVLRLGAEQLGEVTAFPEGRSVYCREPAGSVFELSEVPR
jgi:catechol 2,3-dioxygenase-like lactoylglutathione lyase family enzyme